jgi:hypothetical protein
MYDIIITLKKGDCMTSQTIEQNNETTCSNCKADLTQDYSVSREYINKGAGGLDDEDNEASVICEGFYKKDGAGDYHFEPQSDCNLSTGRFDLLDDSDKCAYCDHQL